MPLSFNTSRSQWDISSPNNRPLCSLDNFFRYYNILTFQASPHAYCTLVTATVTLTYLDGTFHQSFKGKRFPISKTLWKYRIRAPRNTNFLFAKMQDLWKAEGFEVSQELSDAGGVLRSNNICQQAHVFQNTALCSTCLAIIFNLFLHENMFEGQRGGANERCKREAWACENPWLPLVLPLR